MSSYTPTPLKPFKYVMLDIVEFFLCFTLFVKALEYLVKHKYLPNINDIAYIAILLMLVFLSFVFQNLIHNAVKNKIKEKYPKLATYEPTYLHNMVFNFLSAVAAMFTVYYCVFYIFYKP